MNSSIWSMNFLNTSTLLKNDSSIFDAFFFFLPLNGLMLPKKFPTNLNGATNVYFTASFAALNVFPTALNACDTALLTDLNVSDIALVAALTANVTANIAVDTADVANLTGDKTRFEILSVMFPDFLNSSSTAFFRLSKSSDTCFSA